MVIVGGSACECVHALVEDMGQCTIGVISGRRKRRKSRSARVKVTEEEVKISDSTSIPQRKKCSFSRCGSLVVVISTILLLSLPVAIRGNSSLEPTHLGIVERTPPSQVLSGSIKSHERDINSPSSFFFLSSSTDSTVPSSTTSPLVDIDPLTFKSAVSSTSQYLSSFTPAERLIRSSSVHSLRRASQTTNGPADGLVSGVGVTEPIRVTASLPDHHSHGGDYSGHGNKRRGHVLERCRKYARHGRSRDASAVVQHRRSP